MKNNETSLNKLIADDKMQYYLSRDVSWLSFNYRVLQEAMDETVPLLERLKFLAIYSSNLDEFFRVRVSNHRNLVRVGKKTKRKLEFDPEVVLQDVLAEVSRQQVQFSEIFSQQIIPELEINNINLLHYTDLDEDQIEFVTDYFNDHMLPYVQPVLLIKNKIKPFLNNGALYLALILRNKGQRRSRNQYAIVKIPSDHLPRFLELPSEIDQHDVIMLDDVVRYMASWLFPGYNIVDSFSIKLTRDAELYIEDEFSGDLISKIRKSLTKRNVGPASRFVYDREMPVHLLRFLMETFDIEPYDLLPEGRYHNNSDFFKFPDFGNKHLNNEALPPLPYDALEKPKNYWGAIKKRDHLIHVPFHSYESTIRFFEEAAQDPNVLHIKIVQYRVAKKSRIMNALIAAIKAGKQVTVFIEVKARFDEEANLDWGEKLEKAGARVHYSFPGLKVHCKIALIIRKEKNKTSLYTYLSTGNFHEVTAKIYSDFGLFTHNQKITKEVARLFTYLETQKTPKSPFKYLLVGQFNLRPGLEKLIDYEIAAAKKGKKAKIILKMNSLQDRKMVSKLYKASRAGVKIKMIVRGICCLVPGIKGLSENIEVISIVDRFLEHSRIFVFHHGGEEKIYLSSADWMTRNLSHRIETIFPIYDPEIGQSILEYLDIQLNDNVKARIIDGEYSNEYREDDEEIAIRAQLETYYTIRRNL